MRLNNKQSGGLKDDKSASIISVLKDELSTMEKKLSIVKASEEELAEEK